MSVADASRVTPSWLKIYQYKNRRGRFKSSITSERFFFDAAKGRRDPEEEMRAAIQAYESNKIVGTQKQAAACVFPARKRVLEKLLERKFPSPDCADLRDWVGNTHAAACFGCRRFCLIRKPELRRAFLLRGRRSGLSPHRSDVMELLLEKPVYILIDFQPARRPARVGDAPSHLARPERQQQPEGGGLGRTERTLRGQFINRREWFCRPRVRRRMVQLCRWDKGVSNFP